MRFQPLIHPLGRKLSIRAEISEGGGTHDGRGMNNNNGVNNGRIDASREVAVVSFYPAPLPY